MNATGQPSTDLVASGLPAPRIEVAVAPSGTPQPAPALDDPAVDGDPFPPIADLFEGIYASAAGDPAAIPWAHMRPSPLLVSWLNAEAPGLIRPGSRVVVVGCGLGDDVAELDGRGFDVVGFDISLTAVEWARRRFPHLASNFLVADLFSLPSRLARRFELVVEIYTLQSLPPAMRESAARCIASLACSKGHVLAICRGREESELLETLPGRPWPLTVSELCGLMESAGFHAERAISSFLDDETPPAPRLRGLFSR